MTQPARILFTALANLANWVRCSNGSLCKYVGRVLMTIIVTRRIMTIMRIIMIMTIITVRIGNGNSNTNRNSSSNSSSNTNSNSNSNIIVRVRVIVNSSQ